MHSQHLAQLLATPYNSHFPFHREETKARWSEAICPRRTAWSHAAGTPTQAAPQACALTSRLPCPWQSLCGPQVVGDLGSKCQNTGSWCL